MPLARPAQLTRLVRVALLVFFVWLAGRFWHPYYGFTQLLQFDTSAASVMLPSLRDAPIYVFRDTGGYDGLYYAQMATSPGLQDPGLREAIDSLGYRGRRMLLSWVAWLVGAGEPVAAVRAYAWLNIVAWLAVAAVFWRLFPTENWRGTVAWAGLLFSAGCLHSVRLSLTDLTALGFIAGAGLLVARQRQNSAAGLLATVAFLYLHDKDKKDDPARPTAVPGHYQLIDVLDTLKDAGVKATYGDPRSNVNSRLLGAPGQLLTVGDGSVYVFVFPDIATQESATLDVEPDDIDLHTLTGTVIPVSGATLSAHSNIAVLILNLDAGQVALRLLERDHGPAQMRHHLPV